MKNTEIILGVSTVVLAIAATYFGVEYFGTLKDVKTIVKNNTISNWTSISDSNKKKYTAA